MKKTSAVILALLSFSPSVSSASPLQASSPDDLYLQARVDAPSVNWLIDRIRKILNQTPPETPTVETPITTNQTADKLSGDGFKGSIKIGTLDFPLKDLLKDPSYQSFFSVFSSVFSRDLSLAKLRMKLPVLNYDVKKLVAEPTHFEVKDPILTFEAKAGVSGITVQIPKGISIELILPSEINRKKSQTPPTEQVYLAASIDSPSIDIPESLPPLPLTLGFTATRSKELSFKVNHYDLSDAPRYVQQYQSSFILRAGSDQSPIAVSHIQVNPVIVRLNNMNRSIDFDSFKPIIQAKFNSLIALLLTELGKSMQTSIGPNILKTIFSQAITTRVGVKNESLYTQFGIAFIDQPVKDQLRLQSNGGHCTAAAYEKYKEDCVLHEPELKPVRVISDVDKKRSEQEIIDRLASKQSDVALSVSEHYLNRLLRGTIDAKLWDEVLKENGLQLGPKGAFVVLNQKSQNPELILDLIYSDRVYLKFPLRVQTEILLASKSAPVDVIYPLKSSSQPKKQIIAEIPTLEIKIKDILSTPDEIIHGLPEYEMNSRLIRGLRKKLAKIILNLASDIKGTSVLMLDLPEFRGVGIENSDLKVSEFGRLNLYFKTDPIQH
jgi:hypothetical protein